MVVCDKAQSILHHNVDVCDLDVDFLPIKCMPTIITVLYDKYEFLKKMEPFISGGGINDIFNNKGLFVLFK